MYGFSALSRLDSTKPKPNNRRKAARVSCSCVQSQFGEIADLSMTGARIVSKRKPRIAAGDVTELQFEVDAAHTRFPARVIRATKSRRSPGYEIAFEFVQLSSEQKASLRRIARDAIDTGSLVDAG